MDEGSKICTGTTVSGELDLGRESKIGPNSRIGGNVNIGERTNLNGDNVVVGTVDIGSYCAIAKTAEFYVVDHFMKQPAISRQFFRDLLDEELKSVDKGPVNVGNDVWIGRNCMVISGVEIGDGAVIGAGSVVTRDVDPYEIVAGVPAEHKGWRFSESIRSKLIDVSWWDWDDSKIRDNKEFFTANLQENEEILDTVLPN